MVTPLYRGVSRSTLQLVGGPLVLSFPFGPVELRLFRQPMPSGQLYFLDAPELFDRDEYYGYPDDARRFAAFSMGALAFAQREGFVPDVVQANDWPTGLALLALRTGFAHTPMGKAKRVFTIHNLAYQGLFPKFDLETLGIPWDLFTPAGVEFYDRLSFMKTALVSAELITTVSPTYAKEIQTPQFGVGLDGLLRQRADVLHGILNGVDVSGVEPGHRCLPAQAVHREGARRPRAVPQGADRLLPHRRAGRGHAALRSHRPHGGTEGRRPAAGGVAEAARAGRLGHRAGRR